MSDGEREIERSVLKHTFTYHNAMRWPDTVQNMLWTHRRCTPGSGNTQQSCSAKKNLLEIREKNGWTFDLPNP